jgi:hypothetical protein
VDEHSTFKSGLGNRTGISSNFFCWRSSKKSGKQPWLFSSPAHWPFLSESNTSGKLGSMF